MKALRSFLGSLGGDHRMLGQLQDGVTIAQFKNIPNDLLEAVYALGYGHFQSGQLQEAHDVFLYLSFHDHTNTKFLTAFGICCSKLGKLEQADQVLKIACEMDPQDVSAAINLAKTQESLGQLDNARETLLQLSTLLQDNTQYKPLQQLADAMLERLGNEIERGE